MTANSPETFGALLRAVRLAAGLSQADLSDRSGLPKPTLSRYENGHVLPSFLTLRRLALALEVSESALLPGTASPAEIFFDRLRAEGYEIHTRLEAEELADVVSELLAEAKRLEAAD